MEPGRWPYRFPALASWMGWECSDRSPVPWLALRDPRAILALALLLRGLVRYSPGPPPHLLKSRFTGKEGETVNCREGLH